MSGCKGAGNDDAQAEAPPPAQVEQEQDGGAFSVDHPEQYPLATAGKYEAAPELNVTGTVSLDVSRSIPVVSLASGRIVDIHARLGDTVTKGQLLMRVQSQDISQAFSDYRQAVADENLASTQLTARNSYTNTGRLPRTICKLPKTPKPKPKSPSKPRSITCGFWALTPITRRPLWKSALPPRE